MSGEKIALTMSEEEYVNKVAMEVMEAEFIDKLLHEIPSLVLIMPIIFKETWKSLEKYSRMQEAARRIIEASKKED